MVGHTLQPIGELTLRTLAMPADANAAGDIFGGWVMAQMDLACGIRAAERARGRVVTAAVKEMSFAKPMKIGDTLCIYTHIKRVGRTSMTLKVEAWAQRYLSDLMERVTHADFVMVALDRTAGRSRCRWNEQAVRAVGVSHRLRPWTACATVSYAAALLARRLIEPRRASLTRSALRRAHSPSALTGSSSSRPRSVSS